MVRNPFNYTASKDRILDILQKNFDYEKTIFVDMFCGSGVVGVNVANKFERVLLNDGCWQVVKLLEAIYTDKNFLQKVEKIIDQFGLSKTNKEAFLSTREYYNEHFSSYNKFNPQFLYALAMHAFNYQMVFNKSEGFSVPAGTNRSNFNSSLKAKLIAFQQEMVKYDLEFYHFKLGEFINLLKASFIDYDYEELMVYCDPPYSRCCSDGSVNRSYGLKWGENEDKILLNFLDLLHEKGASFVLSNVLENNGKENKLIKKWSEKYNVIPVEVDYNNCFYTKKENLGTKEVIVRNF